MSSSTPAVLGGRVVIVTGGAGGIGSAISHAVTAAGAAVLIADIDASNAESVAAAIAASGGRAEYSRTDVTDSGDVDAMVRHAVETFGHIDCAINAAAVEFENDPLTETSDDDFDRMIRTNLRSVFLCMKAEIKALLAAGTAGSIVNLASINSFRAQVNQPVYTATKHAVVGLTRGAAMDYAKHGIRVNAIAPGAIDTPMLQRALDRRNLDRERMKHRMGLFGRFGEPSEVAAAAVWLCSDSSSFTTGHVLAVDGGYLAY